MEKFGIFELLDALSALSEAPAAAPPPAETAPANGEAPAPPAPPAGSPGKGRAEAEALQGFLARHNAVARKADGKKS